MSFIVRVIISVALLIGLILPALVGFVTPLVGFGRAFLDITGSFINTVGSFFNNVRGMINYFIAYTFGSSVITAFNALIYVGLLSPFMGLVVRLYLCIYRFVI